MSNAEVTRKLKSSIPQNNQINEFFQDFRTLYVRTCGSIIKDNV